MLVLSRLREQTIIIGDDIEVTIVDIRGDKVRLGINAPRSVSVHRKEIYDAVRREREEAARIQPAKTSPEAPAAPAPQKGGDSFIQVAIEEARLGLAEGGLPIGAVLVRGGQVIGRGRNRRVQKGDPMAHAEIDCLTNAGRQQSYKDTILYSTLMPCRLCSGAVVQFGIPRVVVGESINFHGAPDELRRHGVQCTDLHDTDCIQMMAQFIKEHPDLWNEDIGK